jgi:hypothetical protein
MLRWLEGNGNVHHSRGGYLANKKALTDRRLKNANYLPRTSYGFRDEAYITTIYNTYPMILRNLCFYNAAAHFYSLLWDKHGLDRSLTRCRSPPLLFGFESTSKIERRKSG